jgi:hypothetical protein
MVMSDSYGDGWNGATWSIDETGGGLNYSSGSMVNPPPDVLIYPPQESSIISIGGVCGCTDPSAPCDGYDPEADLDDGSCCYDNCAILTIGGSVNDLYVLWFLKDNNGDVLLHGRAPETVELCLLDECYSLLVACPAWGGCGGGTWSLDGYADGVNYGSGNTSGGETLICTPCGCTDPTALNYDSYATCEDYNCLYYCPGDFNYDGQINTTDLLFFLSEFGCNESPCVTDLSGDGLTNTSDLLVFLSTFGTDCY